MNLLDTLPRGDRVLHGDFHPGNLLADGDNVGVIDWVGAARGAPEADHARTQLLLTWGDPQPGTPFMERAVIKMGRSAFASRYVRAYKRGSPRKLDRVSDWFTINVAARMSEGIPAEHPRLLEYLSAAERRHAHNS